MAIFLSSSFRHASGALLCCERMVEQACRQDVDEEDAYDADVDEKDGEWWQQ